MKVLKVFKQYNNRAELESLSERIITVLVQIVLGFPVPELKRLV